MEYNTNSFEIIFLQSAIKHLSYYKNLGDKTFEQLQETDFHYTPNEESNSIAIIIQHLSGNMLSRWTNFLTTDGEKDWRNRDTEFKVQNLTGSELLALWIKGWNCCIDALNNLSEEDLHKTITIREEKLIAIDAINRQLAHIPYHVGQIVYIGKIIKNEGWHNLSIPRDRSNEFNRKMGKK